MAQRLGSDRTNALALVAAMVVLMWATETVDQLGLAALDRYGIRPRDAGALPDVLAAPFLHAGFDHLLANTLPFAAMGAAIALGGLVRVALVTLTVALVSGLGTWLVAPASSIHLGASGVVFGYAAYLVARGLISRRFAELAAGAVVVALWGAGLAQGLLPQERISWQAHLFGAVGGLVAAALLAHPRRRRGAG